MINHRNGEAIKCNFTMNATLQRGKVTVVQRTMIPKVDTLIQDHRFNEGVY